MTDLQPVDLSGIAVVDNHCHPVDGGLEAAVPAWRRHFSESSDPGMQEAAVADTAFYRRLVGRMAAFHGCSATEAAVLAARESRDGAELIRALFADARIDALVVDGGYQPTPDALGGADLADLTGCRAVELLRVEGVFEDLVAAHPRLDDVVGAARSCVAQLRHDGWCGLKSVVGYRTGLDILRWELPEVERSFAAARREVDGAGRVRLGHKPLLDTLLHHVLEEAARQEAPVQFHVGYGDADVDLRTATPLHLRNLFEDPAYRRLPIVLLHGCWPYVREAAFLSSIYPNAYLDLSFGIPFLGLSDLRAVTTAALAAAPWSKLMYSSDGAVVPELHWIAAHDGRAVLGAALAALVADGELAGAEAEGVGRRILNQTATALYGIA
jgi:uncharacterized protein